MSVHNRGFNGLSQVQWQEVQAIAVAAYRCTGPAHQWLRVDAGGDHFIKHAFELCRRRRGQAKVAQGVANQIALPCPGKAGQMIERQSFRTGSERSEIQLGR